MSVSVSNLSGVAVESAGEMDKSWVGEAVGREKTCWIAGWSNPITVIFVKLEV